MSESGIELEQIKTYLKVDSSDEDELISLLLSTAKMYIQEAGIKLDETNPVHRLLILNLIGHFYNNRANTAEQIPLTIQMLLQHAGIATSSENTEVDDTSNTPDADTDTPSIDADAEVDDDV